MIAKTIYNVYAIISVLCITVVCILFLLNPQLNKINRQQYVGGGEVMTQNASSTVTSARVSGVESLQFGENRVVTCYNGAATGGCRIFTYDPAQHTVDMSSLQSFPETIGTLYLSGTYQHSMCKLNDTDFFSSVVSAGKVITNRVARITGTTTIEYGTVVSTSSSAYKAECLTVSSTTALSIAQNGTSIISNLCTFTGTSTSCNAQYSQLLNLGIEVSMQCEEVDTDRLICMMPLGYTYNIATGTYGMIIDVDPTTNVISTSSLQLLQSTVSVNQGTMNLILEKIAKNEFFVSHPLDTSVDTYSARVFRITGTTISGGEQLPLQFLAGTHGISINPNKVIAISNNTSSGEEIRSFTIDRDLLSIVSSTTETYITSPATSSLFSFSELADFGNNNLLIILSLTSTAILGSLTYNSSFDTCEYNGYGNWVMNTNDSCKINRDLYVDGDLTLDGTGTFYLNGTLDVDSISGSPGAKINASSNSKIRIY